MKTENMEKQIVQTRFGYHARYKKWWHLSWRYIGPAKIWRSPHDFTARNTYEEAVSCFDPIKIISNV